MATENPEGLQVDFPNRPIGQWKFNKTDSWFTAASFAILLLANHFLHKPGGLMVLMVWFMLMLPANYGRVYSIFSQQLRFRWQQLAGKDSGSEITIWSANERLLIRRPEPIQLNIQGVDELGLLHGHGKDTIVVQGQGSIISSLGVDGQYDAIQALAEVIRKAGALTLRKGHTVGWGWLYRCRPLDMPKLTHSLEGYLNPEALLPEAVLANKPESEWTANDRRALAFGVNMREVLAVTQSYAREVTMAAVCTVQHEELEKSLVANQVNRLSIVQLAKTLPEELGACGVVDPHALSPREIHSFFRGALDVNHIDDYYRWLVGSTDEEVLTSDKHLPKERISAGPGYLNVDGSFTSVLWLMDTPEKFYPPQLRQLFELPVPWYSVALVGSTTKGKREYALLDRVISITQEFDERAGVIHKGPKKLDQQASRFERQKKVYENRFFGQNYNVFIALHHRDREGLEDAVDQALQSLSLANMTADRVIDPLWQLPFALSATTAIDMNML